MNSTVKLLLEKLIHKAFPEFSNKVTWTLITVGVAILFVPAPTYIMFLNLIIDFYNNTANTHIALLNISSITPSTGAAITLILSGLAYHLAIKAIQIYGEISKWKLDKIESERDANIEKEKNERVANADRKLFESFLNLLPTNSTSIELLKDHDFGASYHNDHLKDIENFTYSWGKADQHFHDSDLEKKSIEFFDETKKFLYFLGMSSGFIGVSSRLSIPTDDERANDWHWSEHTTENVRKANDSSAKLHQLYCNFIATGKSKLSI